MVHDLAALVDDAYALFPENGQAGGHPCVLSL